MARTRIPTIAAALLVSSTGFAQVEVLSPLHAQPRAGAERAMTRAGDLNTFFIYQYEAQDLPLMDDFSIDRTRHLDAQPEDAGVTLTETVYRLEVAGVSTPEMAFRADTTWHYTVDTMPPDTVIITRVANPNVSVTVYDITEYPSPTSLISGWPLYNIFDTVGSVSSAEDTIPLSPDIVQDSLMVYNVAVAGGTYDMNGTPQPLVLWQEDAAYINGTYPIDPPTVGVATFDGLDRTGYPYNTVATSYGRADALTSVPIDLLYDAGDSIYLSFFYQPQGLSGDDQVQPGDSLLLEMYAPDEDEWFLQWYTPYIALAPFQQVMLPITDSRFLKTDFQFRFVNKATLCGALDHWHVDYVRLSVDRTFDDTVLVDVSMLYPESTLLQPYTSMPFDKYAADPGAYMAQTLTTPIKNLDFDPHFITFGMEAGIEGGTQQIFNNGLSPSGNADTTFNALHPINAAPNNYLHDATLSDTCKAYYTVSFFNNTTPDINRYNDTIQFRQELSNYFAYDDGSAEAGYSLNVNGAKLAVRFDMQGGDSLRAVRMYFDPILAENDPTEGNFRVTVWSSLSPEALIHENFTFSSPSYTPWGPNTFVEFPLDSTIWVPATFYVGWTQVDATKMNLGFDKNRGNQDKIFYKTGTSWSNTSFTGSLMIRPVFVSNCDTFTGIEGPAPTSTLFMFPNPAQDVLRFTAPGALQVQLLDAMGRVVRETNAAQQQLDVHDLSNGMYVARALAADRQVIAQARLIVQH